jgi:hypothetical protein
MFMSSVMKRIFFFEDSKNDDLGSTTKRLKKLDSKVVPIENVKSGDFEN